MPKEPPNTTQAVALDPDRGGDGSSPVHRVGDGAPPGPALRPLAAALLFSILLAPLADAADRLTLNFNLDWKFLKSDVPAAIQPAFDDSSWVAVSAPHTFNDTDTFDDWSPPNHVGETNQWSGRTW